MKTKEIYEQLSQYRQFSGKVNLIDEGIKLVFHEYLTLSLYYNKYVDEWTCVVNKNITHWHTHNDDIIINLLNIVEGEIVFIEQRYWFRRFFSNPIRLIKLDEFNIKKDKYLNNKKNRIYSGNCIFKYAE